ncbi:6,7-dimethyl-8-ribityllumazine synthase-like protein [Talaromyces proteolyticus]|uniref:6,7-dimethyl-8-ribityllumazine synthase n=1 Tax=Talaromyces proteolyticus TaxID=1131652 RepID=A0AAD4KNS4_9EURO|nr:6,7-dimethyl-8-ribityllumazine synthase-like protein [Talaromyces proteolyticus]KAH8693513.1 6,7-dimethyl-8-ribityllumazine synthase-like protein [Talaromyces proteolyticus]
MASLKGPGKIETYDGAGLRVAIVHARWNTVIIDALVSGARKSLLSAGVAEQNIVVQSVPGSYELPFAVQRLYAASHVQAAANSSTGDISATDLLSASTTDLTKPATTTTATKDSPSQAPFDAIIAIGVLIKGETMHFEYIADAVSHGLMRVQLDSNVPVVFGLLTLLTEEQGLERAGLGSGKKHNHGEDWGSAAVELAVKRRGWAEGKIA